MGDRYYLQLKCVYCNKLNNPDNDIYPSGVYYAPTCGFETFECKRCKKTNFITSDFKPKKMEDITYDDIYNGFMENTNVEWKEGEIKKICEDRLKQIKKD